MPPPPRKLLRRDRADAPQLRLAQLFKRNGDVRVPREERQRALGPRYKKGWEVRLVLNSREELAEVGQFMKDAGFKGGKPFRKMNQWVQPISGKEHMALLGLGRRAVSSSVPSVGGSA